MSTGNAAHPHHRHTTAHTASHTPSGSPSPTPTKSPDEHSNTAAQTGTHLFSWLAHHPVVPILIVAWAATLYGWKQLRVRAAASGKTLPPLGDITRRILKFAYRENTEPLISRPEKLAARTRNYTGRRHVALMTFLAAAATFAHFPPGGPLPYLLLAALPTVPRARRVFRARWNITLQMFDVAANECRYPRDARLNPTAYIQIQQWEDTTRPGQTVVTFPAAYQSEDQKTREKFERQFNGTVSDEHSWTFKWESSKNRVICTPTPHLPKMAPYPGPFGRKWSEFAVGVSAEGEAIVDVQFAPHVLICGPTGSGKSVVQRMILFHALVHSDTWKIVAIDPKRVELSHLRDYPSVLQVATELEDSVQVTQDVHDEMMRRFDEMQATGVNHFLNLPNPPPALMLMVDEAFAFLSPEGIKSDEGKERDALHARAATLIGSIARLGRAAGCHLVLAAQRPDATVLKGELKNNLDARIAAGRMDTTPSLMVLDDEGATRLPKIKGRGMLRMGGELTTYQGYFAEQSWYDEYLAGVQAGVIDPATGKPFDASGTENGGESRPTFSAGLGRLLPDGLRIRVGQFVAKRAEAAARNEAVVQQLAEAGHTRGRDRTATPTSNEQDTPPISNENVRAGHDTPSGKQNDAAIAPSPQPETHDTTVGTPTPPAPVDETGADGSPDNRSGADIHHVIPPVAPEVPDAPPELDDFEDTFDDGLSDPMSMATPPNPASFDLPEIHLPPVPPPVPPQMGNLMPPPVKPEPHVSQPVPPTPPFSRDAATEGVPQFDALPNFAPLGAKTTRPNVTPEVDAPDPKSVPVPDGDDPSAPVPRPTLPGPPRLGGGIPLRRPNLPG